MQNNKFLKCMQEGFVLFDGGLGSELIARGMSAGETSESCTLTRPATLLAIHRAYAEAGAMVLTANSFGANPLKLCDAEQMRLLVTRAVALAKEAAAPYGAFVALDVGPCGRLLSPAGDLRFEEAVDAFTLLSRCGAEAGADLILIETMHDLYEAKAAVLAAKSTGLPIVASVSFGAHGKLLTGADPAAVVAVLEGLGVDALGANCGGGPDALLLCVEQLLRYASVPVLMMPNAGLPVTENGQLRYTLGVEDFVDTLRLAVLKGVRLVGGCCGTTPKYIAALNQMLQEETPLPLTEKDDTLVCGRGEALHIGERFLIVGERINPTGKPRLKAALRSGDYSLPLHEAVAQQDAGANALDVNVGLPDIDEAVALPSLIEAVQSVSDLTLQPDSSNIDALAAALRIYNGKALVNSVNGKKESMERLFPIVKRYGGALIALTLDENGIPDTAEGRLSIAERIVCTAAKYGIAKKDIIIDPLCLSVSAVPNAAELALAALRLVRDRLQVRTLLGLSNISFGLPQRERLNAAFLTLGLYQGADLAILNPFNERLQQARIEAEALLGRDEGFAAYLGAFAGEEAQRSHVSVDADPVERLNEAVFKGLKVEAAAAAKDALTIKEPLQLIDLAVVPALERVGESFGKGQVFLPQLMQSAEAAKSAFQQISSKLPANGGTRGSIILATVEGDIHDIGKNIVKALLENYRFRVIDLGRDVSPERVLAAAQEQNVTLVGLSALMTTTVPAMEKTVKLIKHELPACRVMVGGAVLTEELALSLGADRYIADARAAVLYAQELFLLV